MKPLQLILTLLLTLSLHAGDLPYPIVDTGQDRTFSNDREIAYPAKNTEFSGQDAQYQGIQPRYKDNGDGTVTDLNTGLTWVKSPDFKNKSTYQQAVAGAKTCRVGGYTDWRLPSIKELYSLIDFRGYSTATEAASKPYIDTRYFDFSYGDSAKGDRLIDSQYASSTLYVGQHGRNLGGKLFGVNFADGRIKGYDLVVHGKPKTFVVMYVRGNPDYGKNDFHKNADGTITDRATGLTWQTADSGKPMTWQQALAYAENLKLGGHSDWRLPNAKELQSIIDYSRSPTATDAGHKGAAIDPLFSVTSDEAWYWSSTTHLEGHTATAAVYLAFGQALGTMFGRSIDIHGAGSQRSDPKSGDPAAYAGGRGPQGDQVRILNYVRCVRGGDVTQVETGPTLDPSFASPARRPDAPPPQRSGGYPLPPLPPPRR